MEMNRDKDEMLIKQAFDEMNTAEFNIAAAITKREAAQKKSRPKVFRRSFVIAFAIVALTATTIAAGYYLSMIERIHEAVGEDMAAAINPANAIISTADFDWYVHSWSEEELAYDGIAVEIIAVGAFDNILDVYFVLEDLNSNRLDDFFDIQTLVPFGENDVLTMQRDSTILERFDDGRVLVRARHFSEAPITSGIQQLVVSSVRHFIIEEEMGLAGVELDNLAPAETLETNLSPLMVTTFGGRNHDARHLFRNGELLVPQQMNMPLHIESQEVDFTITAVGIINNQLRVQIHYPSGRVPGGHEHIRHIISLYDASSGDFIGPSASMSFNVDENGNLYGGSSFSFEEYLFEVDIDKLHNFSIRSQFSIFIDIPVVTGFDIEITANHIAAEHMAVSLDMNMRFLINTQENDTTFTFVPAKVESVRINSFTATIAGSFMDFNFNFLRNHDSPIGENPVLPSFWSNELPEESLRIYTTNGLITPQFARIFYEQFFTGFTILFEMDELLDLDSITAVYLSGIRVE